MDLDGALTVAADCCARPVVKALITNRKSGKQINHWGVLKLVYQSLQVLRGLQSTSKAGLGALLKSPLMAIMVL